MRVVLCNCPPVASEGIASALVKEGLSACVNVIPGVKSFFVWDGKLTVEEEHTLLIKVGEPQLGRLRSRLKALHPYELPEIVVLQVDMQASLADYVKWVRSCGPIAPTKAAPE